MRIQAAAMAMVLATAGTSRGEEPATLGVGSRVRIQQGTTKGGPWLVGVLAATDAETLTLSLGRGHTREVRWRDVRRVDVSRGRRSVGSGMLRGAGFGLLAGVAAGGLLALGERDDTCSPVEGGYFDGLCLALSARDKRTLDVAGMGLVGTSVGLVVGGAARGERWQRAGERRVQVLPSADAHGRGAGVALSVSF
jgi:hypothetical protein